MNFSEYCKKRDAELNESVYPPAPFTGDKPWTARKSNLNLSGLVKSQTGKEQTGQESVFDKLKQAGKAVTILVWTPAMLRWGAENLPKASKWTAEQIKELKRMQRQA